MGNGTFLSPEGAFAHEPLRWIARKERRSGLDASSIRSKEGIPIPMTELLFEPDRRSSRSFRGRAAALLLSVVLLSASASPSLAHDHDPTMAGHPLRIAAYVLHPIGVVLDYLIFRPAHWIASHEPIQTLVGHED